MLQAARAACRLTQTTAAVDKHNHQPSRVAEALAIVKTNDVGRCVSSLLKRQRRRRRRRVKQKSEHRQMCSLQLQKLADLRREY